MLPSEMIAEIGLYLDLKDVLNCCLVSKAWRNGMNDNRIWKRLLYPCFDWTSRRVPRLERRIDGVYDPILRHKCFVDPPFKLPENVGEGLDILCAWRIRFMQEKRIQYNFLHGKYTFQPANEAFVQDLHSWVREFDRKRPQFNDDYFILFFHKRNIFKVWKQLSSGEICESEPIKLALSDKEVVAFGLTLNGFFYVQEHLLVYYEKMEGDLELKMRVILHEEPEFSINVPSVDDLTGWYRNNIVLEDTLKGMYYDNKYFLAELRLESYSQLHIWDLKSGKKHKRQINLKIDFNVSFKCQITNGKLYFFYYFGNRLMFDRVYLFNLNESNGKMKTFLRVSGCYTPDFHRLKLVYLRIGRRNHLKTCDLVSKKINSTVVEGKIATLVSTFYVTVLKRPLFTYSTDELVTLYNIESLEQVKIKVKQLGAHFITPEIYYNFSNGLVVRNIKDDNEIIIPLHCILFISETKFIDSFTNLIYHFW